MTLIERARYKRALSIDKIPSEKKQEIIDSIMSAAENGYSYAMISNLDSDEARLIRLWLISEGFDTDISVHSTEEIVTAYW
jgi:hypothetical protein